MSVIKEAIAISSFPIHSGLSLQQQAEDLIGQPSRVNQAGKSGQIYGALSQA